MGRASPGAASLAKKGADKELRVGDEGLHSVYMQPFCASIACSREAWRPKTGGR